MKKIQLFAGIITAALLLTVFAGAALASGPNIATDLASDSQNGRWMRNGFVDADGDNLNDNALYTHEFVDEDGDGVCDLHPDGEYQFVDEDGDGVCDLNDGSQMGGRYQGQGRYFVDADGDGLNDNAQFVDEDGDGLNDNAQFVDEDGDGACDLYDGSQMMGGRGGRGGRGMGTNR